MQNLKKKDTNELTCRTETDSQSLKTNYGYESGQVAVGEGWTEGLGFAQEHCTTWNDWPTET